MSDLFGNSLLVFPRGGSNVLIYLVPDTKFMWGGYPAQHAFAQEDSWRRIIEHFNKYIARTSNCDIQGGISKL